MATFVLPLSLLLLLALVAGHVTAGSAASKCPVGQEYCYGAQGADSSGCCGYPNFNCCDRGGGVKLCYDKKSGPCCPLAKEYCTSNITVCVDKKDLCGGECCVTPTGFGRCCGGKKCCKYNTSKCGTKGHTKGQCKARCNEGCKNGSHKSKLCKEPHVCCQGKCVNPAVGKATLPCKGLCCDFNDVLAIPNSPPAFPEEKINGLCCQDQCCIGNQTCCTGSDGTSCGIQCGKNKCCRGQQKCCGGKCVDDNVWCKGKCCDFEFGICCGGDCCPQPQVCCGSPFPGDLFGKCCGPDQSCCRDGCCPKGKACACGPFKDSCCP